MLLILCIFENIIDYVVVVPIKCLVLVSVIIFLDMIPYSLIVSSVQYILGLPTRLLANIHFLNLFPLKHVEKVNKSILTLIATRIDK